MYRAAVIILILIFAGLQYRLWIGDGSWAQVHRVTQMRDALHAANVKRQARNEALADEIADLKSGKAATAGRARADLGMIKPDETFFLTVAKPGDRVGD
jgi:cell division protein FtsB